MRWGAVALGSLVAAALAGGPEREVRMAFLGDAGTGGRDQKAVRDQLLLHAPPFVFLLGDNIYESGSASQIKDRFDDVYAPLMARGTVFHAALGNHDVLRCRAVDGDPLPPDAAAYRSEPGCDVAAQLAHPPFGYKDGRRYYSVVLGGGFPPLVEVFVLDSNTLGVRNKLPAGREDRAQLQWLDRALGASQAIWKVATFHHAIHTPQGLAFLGFAGHAPEMEVRGQLEPLFQRHGVDVVFSGHNHFYARMAPQGGVRYFVSGGGGRHLYGLDPQPGYVAEGGAFFHFVEVRLTPGAFEFQAVDSEGRSRDAGRFAREGRVGARPSSSHP